MKVNKLIAFGLPLVIGIGCAVGALIVTSKVIALALAIFAMIAAIVPLTKIKEVEEKRSREVDHMYEAYLLVKKEENGELAFADLVPSTKIIERGIKAAKRLNKNSCFNFI